MIAERFVLKGCLLGVLCFGAGCASTTAPPSGPATPMRPEARPSGPVPGGAAVEQGKASYYSDKLTGRSTASGEPYDPKELTAAHRTLPFGTVVDVARDDGRHVVVRINDRGPFARGRVIDLSRQAADSIGMIRDGVCQVSLRIVSMPPPKKKKKRRRSRR